MGFNTLIVGRPRGGQFCRLYIALAAVVALATALSACGQKGALYLPTEPAARDRATLPQVLLPLPRASAPQAPSAPSPAVPVAPAPSASASR